MKKQNAEPADSGTRRWIANVLVIGGIVVVGVLGVLVIKYTAIDKRHEASQLVLTSILPLVGTWIGTVLAFYFAKDNFESASRATRESMLGFVRPYHNPTRNGTGSAAKPSAGGLRRPRRV